MMNVTIRSDSVKICRLTKDMHEDILTLPKFTENLYKSKQINPKYSQNPPFMILVPFFFSLYTEKHNSKKNSI